MAQGALSQLPPQQNIQAIKSAVNDPDIVGQSPVDINEENPQNPPNIMDHYVNLVDCFPDDVIHDATRELMDDVDEDVQVHKKSIDTVESILKNLGFDRTMDTRSEPFEGASGVVNPIMVKAGTDLSSRLLAELNPSAGPTKCEISGLPSADKDTRALRVKNYMDLQQTALISGYKRQEDLMITQTVYAGTGFKKIFYNGNKIESAYIPVDKMVIPFHAETIEQAERFTHMINLSEFQMDKLQEEGYYKVEGLPPPSPLEANSLNTAEERISGMKQVMQDSAGMYTVYEVRCMLKLPDPLSQNKMAPYVLTYEATGKNILRLSRDWDIEDPSRTRDEAIIDYGIYPWKGCYSLGLWNQLGGLQRAGTSALRSLLDSGALANTPMWFRLKSLKAGSSSGTQLKLEPMKITEIDASGMPNVTNINQVMMPVPTPQPNPILLQLMQHLEDQAGQYAAASAEMIAESSNTAPVGTTLALLEENAKGFNVIFSRIYDSKRRELEIIKKLNYRHIDDNQIQLQFGEPIVYRADFAPDLTVRPVADPNRSTFSQKIAQFGVMLDLSQKAPQWFNVQKLLQKGIVDLGMVDFQDCLIPIPPSPMPRDPIGNVQAILQGLQVQAFPGEDCDAHIAVYTQILQDPLLGLNPMMAQKLNQPLFNLIGEYVTMRASNLYGHVISNDPTKPFPIGTADPSSNIPRNNAKAYVMAHHGGHVLASERLTADTLIPALTAAAALIPPPIQDPLQVSAKAEQDSVVQKHQAAQLKAASEALETESRERIAQLNADSKVDAAMISAAKSGTPPAVPYASTPEGQLPAANLSSVGPDTINALFQQFMAMIQQSGWSPPASGNAPNPLTDPPPGVAPPGASAGIRGPFGGEPGNIAQTALHTGTP